MSNAPARLDVATLPKAVREFVTEAYTAVDADDNVTQLAILDSILNADTVETILGDADVSSLGDHVNRELWLHAYRWNPSDKADGIGVFMSIEASNDKDGDRFIVNSGSLTIMAQVFALAKADKLPVQVTVTKKDTPTKNGYYPMRLDLVRGEFVTD